jgi:hypothetical protein
MAGQKAIPFSTASRPALGLTSLLSSGHLVALFLGADDSQPSSADIKNECIPEYVFIVLWLLTAHRYFIFTWYLFCVSIPDYAVSTGTLSCKPSNFWIRVKKVINKAKRMCGGNHQNMKWSEVKWSEVKWNEGKWSKVKESKLWWGCVWRVRKCSEVEWRGGHGEMWVHQFMTLHIPLLLLFSV